MRLKFTRTAAASVLAAAALTVTGLTTAHAGEITGTGQPTQGPAHANSICVFSGLEDGGEAPGAPSGPGVTPQNWGQTFRQAKAQGLTMDDAKAAGVQPGESCNGHTGFLAGGGEEP